MRKVDRKQINQKPAQAAAIPFVPSSHGPPKHLMNKDILTLHMLIYVTAGNHSSIKIVLKLSN